MQPIMRSRASFEPGTPLTASPAAYPPVARAGHVDQWYPRTCRASSGGVCMIVDRGEQRDVSRSRCVIVRCTTHSQQLRQHRASAELADHGVRSRMPISGDSCLDHLDDTSLRKIRVREPGRRHLAILGTVSHTRSRRHMREISVYAEQCSGHLQPVYSLLPKHFPSEFKDGRTFVAFLVVRCLLTVENHHTIVLPT